MLGYKLKYTRTHIDANTHAHFFQLTFSIEATSIGVVLTNGWTINKSAKQLFLCKFIVVGVVVIAVAVDIVWFNKIYLPTVDISIGSLC